MDEEELELEELYIWLDGLTLSRSKKNISRDFSDGVLMADVLKKFFPRLVEIHNYSPANAVVSKMNNWTTLNKKVLSKLDLTLDQETISSIVACTPGAIEGVLLRVKKTIENRSERRIHGTNAHLSFYADACEMPELDENTNDCELWQKHAKVLSQNLSKLKRDSEEKDEVIDILQKKVMHLEEMLQLKDLRLTDLTKQLNRYQKENLNKMVT